MQRMNIMTVCLALLVAGGVKAHADIFRMADGSHRVGRIVAQETNYLSVMIDADGIRSLVRIPRAELYYIVPAGTTDPLTGQSAPPNSLTRPIAFLSDSPGGSDAPADSAGSQPGKIILRGPAPASTQAATAKAKLPPASPQFFTQMGKMLAGDGTDLSDPATISPQNRKYWDAALVADEAGDKRAALDNMLALAKAYERQPARLNLLAMRTKNIPFSAWMAQTRWDVWMIPPRKPLFDTSTVVEIERYELIRLLRSKTQEALEPLKTYFPPEKPRAATSGPASRPLTLPVAPLSPANNPLNAITVANTLEVRDKAQYASAILSAQMKLEPDMPPIDRLYLAEQSRNVQAVLTRTTQTLPGALAAKEKADREKRLAEEKAAKQQR